MLISQRWTGLSGMSRLVIEVSVRQIPRCPDGGKRSHSLHSHYQRHLQDRPWQGRAVRLRLRARRFRCRNPACSRKIFVERLPQVAAVYGRQSERLQEIVRCVGFVAGGLPGSRLLSRLAIAISDDTVLRVVKLSPVTASKEEPVRCLGVDDWAWRKGQNYGTMLVRSRQALCCGSIADRSANELADWLAQHPTVSVISRDRFGL
jgi:zinc-finger of transposase IS204/IS1001/IS1096/IS1165